MKIGVKTYSNKEYVEHFSTKVDFIEVMGIAKEEFLKNKNIIVHCKHERFGVNIADKTKEQINLEALRSAVDVANFCNSKRIIVHPGVIENEDCSLENSIAFLKKINDKRIIIENLPYKNKNNKQNLCSTPKNTKLFLENYSASCCLDINHAISSALSQNLGPYALLEDFQKLNPQEIHLGGQTIPGDKTHISLSESNIDLKQALKYLPENSEIILEVTQDIKETEKDIQILKEVLKELKSSKK